jgi:hypothetical protein
MRKPSLLHWILFFPALLLLLLCLGVTALVLALAPPAVSGVAVGLLVVCGAWFFLARRRGSSTLTEGSLMGSQSSKEGLL